MDAPNHEYYMQQALKEARKAYADDEVPIGAVIVMEDKVIARGYNQTERLTDPTAHAEIIALTSAFNYLGSKYLGPATIYITVEPCLMCAGALYWSKIGQVVYGADDEKNGYRRGIRPENLSGPGPWPFHPKTTLVSGILKDECARLMQEFFQSKRLR
ncbi:MAG TPA: nucleoside deaminase [Puia sp.]|nr:nucleoside deaminase [Puia sp.]